MLTRSLPRGVDRSRCGFVRSSVGRRTGHLEHCGGSGFWADGQTRMGQVRRASISQEGGYARPQRDTHRNSCIRI